MSQTTQTTSTTTTTLHKVAVIPNKKYQRAGLESYATLLKKCTRPARTSTSSRTSHHSHRPRNSQSTTRPQAPEAALIFALTNAPLPLISFPSSSSCFSNASRLTSSRQFYSNHGGTLPKSRYRNDRHQEAHSQALNQQVRAEGRPETGDAPQPAERAEGQEGIF